MERKALKNETKARSPQVFRPTEPEDLLWKVPTLIERYIRGTILSEDYQESIEYLIAARILIKLLSGLEEVKISVKFKPR